MVDTSEANLAGAGIDGCGDVVLADAGYCSEDNLAKAADGTVDMLIATGRLKHNERVSDAPRGPIPKDPTARERMARRLRTTTAGRAHYARRKVIVEPAFAQMKVRQRAGHLRLLGLEGARGEWMLRALPQPPQARQRERHIASCGFMTRLSPLRAHD